MTLYPRLTPSLITCAVLTFAGSARAQDFFRDFGTSRSSGGIGPVAPSEYTYQDATPSGLQAVTPPEESEYQEKYNFALGPVRFSIAAGLGLEFNDNINLSDNDRQSDFILRPSLNIDGSWKVSESNTLRLSLGLSYAKYFDHPDYDTEGLLISPTSELALSFQLGAIKFTLRGRGSYQEDTYDVPQLSDVVRYRRAETQAGIQFDWAFNESTNIIFGYDHYNLFTFDKEFAAEERAIDTVFLKPEVQVSPTVKVGVVGTFSGINFKEDNRQDGNNVLVGPLIEWKATEVLTAYLEGGVQILRFDGTSTFDRDFFRDLTDEERRLFRDDEDSTSWYVKFQLDHRANEYFTQRISASKTAEIGLGSDFYDLYHFEYTADWTNFIANTQFGPTLFYEYYETSGPLREEAHRFGAALGLRYNLTNSITLGLDYRFLLKNSNIRDADYYQNLAFVSIYYKF